MKNTDQKGFSLIELLLVVTIIGVIAALAVPAYQKSTRAAENGSTISALRLISSSQLMFYSQNSRFGRLTEVRSGYGNSLGTMVDGRLIRGRYTFEMEPLAPTDAELTSEYTVTATRTGDDAIYKYKVTQSGEIEQIFP